MARINVVTDETANAEQKAVDAGRKLTHERRIC